MDNNRIDLMSPAFIAGFVGMAIRGDAAGFVIAFGSMWLFLFLVLLLDAFLKERRIDRHDAADARSSTRLHT